MNPLDSPISFFPPRQFANPSKTLTLRDALADIQSSKYRAGIESLRTLNGKQYTAKKKQLPSFTPCGVFSSREKAGLLAHSGIVHGDIDQEQLGTRDVEDVKTQLCLDPRTVFCFISPSGKGLKFGVCVAPVNDDEAYKHAWTAVEAEYASRTGVHWDTSGKDISRLCFLSWDPKIYMNSATAEFCIPPAPAIPVKNDVLPAPNNPALAAEALRRAAAVLDRSVLGGDEHHDGRHKSRLNAGYFLGGCVGGGWLSEDEALKGIEAAVARNTHDPDQAMQTMRDQVRAGQAKPIAPDQLYAWNSQAGGATPLGDKTNAEALIDRYGVDLRYCTSWKKWVVWNGKQWEKDEGGSQLMQRAVDALHALKATVDGIFTEAEAEAEARKKAWQAHFKKSFQLRGLRDLIALAAQEPSIAVPAEQFSTHPWLLNCHNGTLDLHTGTLRAHSREDMITACLEIAYDPAAICPTWDAFLWRIMGGDANGEDNASSRIAKDLIAYIQRCVGYALTGSMQEQFLLMFWGTGANGKTTLVNTLLAVLGAYGMQASDGFMGESHYTDHHEPLRLYGKRLVAATEYKAGARLNEVVIKKLTGGEKVVARPLYGEWEEFIPTHTIIMSTNHRPVICGTDRGVWRRISCVPFGIEIPEAEQDKHLADKLKAELPGILAWAVRGCLEWQRGGLRPPDAVMYSTKMYRDDQDVIGRFIDQCCIVGSHHEIGELDMLGRPVETRSVRQVGTLILYTHYKQWCELTGECAQTQGVFTDRLHAKGLLKRKVHGGIMVFEGIETTGQPLDSLL